MTTSDWVTPYWLLVVGLGVVVLAIAVCGLFRVTGSKKRQKGVTPPSHYSKKRQ